MAGFTRPLPSERTIRTIGTTRNKETNQSRTRPITLNGTPTSRDLFPQQQSISVRRLTYRALAQWLEAQEAMLHRTKCVLLCISWIFCKNIHVSMTSTNAVRNVIFLGNFRAATFSCNGLGRSRGQRSRSASLYLETALKPLTLHWAESAVLTAAHAHVLPAACPW